ncbi:pyridoxamine 5'-phosphate oxidase family protein [Winogradskyella sp. MIT101101]|uniref:pyridoxamine 5'-phosphate oxidase family protein n=1 Tax=Winogradskyella sp. MIT101101 TaxID=3098297 RepID=UPI003999EDA6
MKTNDLKGDDAIKKIKSIIERNPIAMLVADLKMDSPTVCPMTVKGMDGKGILWFLSTKDSDHYKSIEEDQRILLTFSNESNHEYLSVTGLASHVSSKTVIDTLWKDEDAKWYHNGRDDDNVVALKVGIVDAYYWDRS